MAEKVLNVADKETLDLINEKFGATSDPGGSSTEGSLMAKLNEMLEQLGISTTGSTVQEVLEELLNSPKIIKSIQFGYFRHEPSSVGGDNVLLPQTITINTINPKKAFVLINGSASSSSVSNSSYDVNLMCTQIQANSITIAGGTSSGRSSKSACSWQVIEYV